MIDKIDSRVLAVLHGQTLRYEMRALSVYIRVCVNVHECIYRKQRNKQERKKKRERETIYILCGWV